MTLWLSLSTFLLIACTDSHQRDQQSISILIDDAELPKEPSYSCEGKHCKVTICPGQGRKKTTSRCLTANGRAWGASTTTNVATIIDLSQYNEFEMWFRVPHAVDDSHTIDMTVTIWGTNEFRQHRKLTLTRLKSPLKQWRKISIPLSNISRQTFLLSFEIQLLTGGAEIELHFDDIRVVKNSTTDQSSDSKILVEPVYPTNAAWNDYVKNDNPRQDVFHQDDVACTPGDGPGYGACIHGGEKRKATVSGETSCKGLTARDRLNAFDWLCFDQGGIVTWYSIGLTPESRLSHLIDGTTGTWRVNQLIVERSAVPIATSEPAIWWTNPLIELETVDDPNPATAAIELEVSGGIYYVANDLTAKTGYTVNARKVAIVVLEDATLSYSDNATGEKNCYDGSLCLIDMATSSNFSWVEGQFSGDSLGRVDQLISAEALYFAVFRHIESLWAVGQAIDLRNIENSLVSNIYVHDNLGHGLRLHWGSYAVEMHHVAALRNSGDGIYIDNVQASRFFALTATDNGAYGIQLRSGSTNFVQGAVASYNQLSGIKLASGRDHLQYVRATNNGEAGILTRFFHGSIAQVVSANNGYHGLQMEAGSQGSFVVAATTANNLGSGIYFDNSPQSIIGGLAAVNNNGSGLQLASNSDNHYIYASTLGYNSAEELRIDSHYTTVQDLQISDASNCAITGNNNNVELAGVCRYTTGIPIAVADPSASFVGRLPTSETNSTTLTNGKFLPNTALTNRINFDHDLRSQSPAGDSFPSDATQGRCTIDITCHLWDWSSSKTDTTLRAQNALPDGNSVGTFFWNASNANECTQLGGVWNTPTPGDCTGPFLLHAYEVMNDQLGNDNNLCEDGEACIYTPNHGAYQGHGHLTRVNFVDGIITNVQLLTWSENGR